MDRDDLTYAGEAPRTTAIAYTTVLPAGTVVINSNLAVPKKNTKTAAIVGGALGGLVVLILAGIALFFFLRRRRRRQEALDPFDPEPTTTGTRSHPREISEASASSVSAGEAHHGHYNAPPQQTRQLFVRNPSSVISARASVDQNSVMSNGQGMSSMYTGTSVVGHGAPQSHYRSPSSASEYSASTGSGQQLVPQRMWSPYTVSGMGMGIGMVQEEGLGQGQPNTSSGGGAPYSRDSGIVEIIDTDDLEDPFIGSGEISPSGSGGHRGVLVHEDGGSVVDLSRGSMTNMSRPPAYEVGS
ncbi:hypothetical protein H1R20_g1619, partial [Candolleomyces eurysporus]